MTVYGPVAYIILVASIGVSAPLDKKICVLTAASQLPEIPELRIQDKNFAETDKSEAARIIVKSFDSVEFAAETLDKVFYFLDGRTRESMRTAFAQGRYEDGEQIVMSLFSERLLTAAKISLRVRAAGEEATYNFVCAWDSAGNHFVRRIGISD